MSTERISILALEDDVKLGDGIKLRFGDGADREDPAAGDVYLSWDGTQFVINGSIVPATATTAQQVYQSRGTVAYTDTSAKDLFTIPANADVVGITVNVTTVFNDSGTDVLDVGKTGTGNHFRNDLDVSAGGQTVTGWSNLGDVGGSAVTVTATYTGQNANSSAGAATVIFFWTLA